MLQHTEPIRFLLFAGLTQGFESLYLQLISEDVGMKLEKADPTMLGRAKKVRRFLLPAFYFSTILVEPALANSALCSLQYVHEGHSLRAAYEYADEVRSQCET